jgi:hypothetical protein
MLCPLCHSSLSVKIQHLQVASEIYHCQSCDLILKAPQSHLDWAAQKERYDLHDNSIESPGYIDFFEQLLKPLRPHLSGLQRALDWGSGPGEKPVFAELLRREGLAVELYDPIYHPVAPSSEYDLITSTEVIEHFHEPRVAFGEIFSHLRAGGVFAGLTQFHQGPEKFSSWWYVKDVTHVVFYSEKTLQWIAREWNLEVLSLGNPVFIFRRKV